MTAENRAQTAIECAGVVKDYGSGRGVFDLDLEVRTGEVFGFIGTNGAGKTTTIRLLMDLIRPDRGTVKVLGLDSHAESLALKRRIGYLPGELAQFPGVSASYILGLLSGLRGDVDPHAITTLAERFELDLRRKYEELSHGNKQKVALIAAFMHQPELLVLDEPTLGLDPLMQREFRQLVRERVAEGATVFLSSHVLSEVEQACDRLALLKAGRVVRAGTLEELRAMRTHRIEARIQNTVDARELLALDGVSAVEVQEHLVTCSVHGPISPLLQRLEAAGITELDSHEMSLEDLFFAQIGEPDAAPAGR